jgi:hypothetical protein
MKVVGRRLQKKGEWLHHEGYRKKAAEHRKGENGCIMEIVGKRLQNMIEKGRMAAS